MSSASADMAEIDALLERLAASSLADRVQRLAPLGTRTTYRVGGSAAALVTVDSRSDVETLLSSVNGSDVETLVIGRGSNMLVSDNGFEGLAIALGNAFYRISFNDVYMTAGAGANLPIAARASVARGLTGFEWAVGVPGSIGGAVRMNAGGHGSSVADAIQRAFVADFSAGTLESRNVDVLELAYRSSALRDCELVLEAEFRLARGDADLGRKTLSEIVQWRRDNQPGGQNAGSVFMNPLGDSAGRLIESAGLKGLRIGSAQVSSKHANFIQTDPGGLAVDVRRVMDVVRQQVFEKHGVELFFETRLVGFSEGKA